MPADEYSEWFFLNYSTRLIFPCRYSDQPQKLSVKDWREQYSIHHLPSVLVITQPKHKQINYQARWFHTENLITEISYKDFPSAERAAWEGWGSQDQQLQGETAILVATRARGTKEGGVVTETP